MREGPVANKRRRRDARSLNTKLAPTGLAYDARIDFPNLDAMASIAARLRVRPVRPPEQEAGLRTARGKVEWRPKIGERDDSTLDGRYSPIRVGLGQLETIFMATAAP